MTKILTPPKFWPCNSPLKGIVCLLLAFRLQVPFLISAKLSLPGGSLPYNVYTGVSKWTGYLLSHVRFMTGYIFWAMFYHRVSIWWFWAILDLWQGIYFEPSHIYDRVYILGNVFSLGINLMILTIYLTIPLLLGYW